MNVVEVFKTNVSHEEEASQLVGLLRIHFPNCRINFDLHDSDKILRVEGIQVGTDDVIAIVAEKGYYCEAL